ncbi:MAG: DNA polymerase IV [Candidatus Marsarchaeota archaeon]|nr:DNA polymerase IV [Candidatus Marsarchaeota archaeon]MCL5122654.1 DNA polymerase IV [Candidatus Marsarchaeota archaeon]
MPVMLVDMDYFYAACEELRHPEFKGKPLIVGNAGANDKTRGVVQTCNYEARAFGIHSGMPLSDAFKLKPDVNYLESDEGYYERESLQIMAMLRSYGFRMEVMSIDEAALDLDGMGYGEALELAKKVKGSIMERFGLKCTIGISSTKTYAKMACDAAKPDGLLVIEDSQVLEFISGKNIGKLPGIGKKTGSILNGMGVHTIGEIAKLDPTLLMTKLGSFGIEIYLTAKGKDPSKVIEQGAALSISRERTISFRPASAEALDKMLHTLADEVWDELNKQGYWFRGVSLKVRYNDFTEHIKNRSFSNNEGSKELIYESAKKMLEGVEKDKRIRKIGVRVFGLVQRKGQKTLA